MSNVGVGEIEEPILFHRSLMAYRSPWSPTAEVGELYLLRGAIVSAFSHADQIAMKVAARASKLAQYDIRPKPPTTTTERIEYLRKINQLDGPLHAHRDLLLGALDRLEALNGFRTMIAHASYVALGRGAVSFPETVKVYGKRELVSRHNSMTLQELRRTALKYALFSRTCERLYYKLSEAALLPVVAFQGGWHSRRSPAGESRTLPWAGD